MTKTYEAVWHNPHNPGTGVDIIVARGSKDYVTKCAQMSQFVPFTIREYQTPDDVRADYRAWRRQNRMRKPDRAVVKMHWEDGENTGKGYQVDTVALSRCDGIRLPADDGEILFYASGLKGLLSLMKPGNGSDFVIDEVLEFYKTEKQTRNNA